jgi:hypothetical protein
MKKTILAFGILIASLVLAAQNTITLTLGSTDITYLAPGDTVYVPIICTDIGPSNIISGAQYTFEMDPAVISWTGNFTTNFGNPNDWMFFYSGDQMIALSGFGFASPGMTLISFEFIYQGGQTPLTWGYSEVYDENFDYYYVTIIESACICDLPDYAVTFHVTADDEDLQGAIITIGNLWLETDENGLATFSLSDGQYDYTVTKPGYADEEGSFTVAGAPVDVEVEMVGCWDVTFNVIPADSTIIIINGDTLVSGETICLPNGMYSFAVSSPGYNPYGGMITVSGASLNIMIVLQPILYDVTFFINCCGEPVENCIITYQGQTVITNAAGLAILNLVAGFYSFEIGGVPVTFTVPDTTYVPVDICNEVTFHTTDEGGSNLEGVHIDINGENLVTGVNGTADICLQTGTYDYTAYKAGYVMQTGTIEVDTTAQTIEIVMPAQTWAVTINVTGYECDNEFEELIIVCNGDTVSVGQPIFLENGSYDFEVAIEGCPALATGSLEVLNAPLTIEVNINDFPKAIISVLNIGGTVPGVEVILDNEDTLYTSYHNGLYSAEFCVSGGNHYVYFPEYGDGGEFIFNCEEDVFLMLMVGQEENYMNSEYNIYPNPSNGKFCLETQNLKTEPIEIMVMDLTCRQVYEENAVVTGKKEINLSGQPKGMYFVKVKTDKNYTTRKLIIN